MSQEITKAVVEVAGKVAETLAPEVVKKAWSWVSSSKNPLGRAERAGLERRRTADRRVSGVARRLRRGLWLEYHRKTDIGKFDLLDASMRTRDKLFDACIVETARYEFIDPNSRGAVHPANILDSAIDAAFAQAAERTAIVIVEEVARHLLAKYNVAAIDRRKGQRRTAAAR